MSKSGNIRYLRQTAGEYYPLDRLLEFDSYFTKEHTILRDLKRRKALAEYVGGLGFRRLTYFDSGEHALVLDTVDDQLVRIVQKSERRRDSIPYVLQPIYATSDNVEEMLGFRIEVLPKLHAKGTGEGRHIYSLEVALAKSDYYFRSHTLENVRLLPDGTPIIVDADAVLTETEYRKGLRGPYLIIGVQSSETLKNRPDPPYYWGEMDDINSWTQKKLIPQIGTGDITGVISGSRLRTLETKLRHNDPLVVAIRDEGLYPAQFPEAMKYRMAVVEGRVLN